MRIISIAFAAFIVYCAGCPAALAQTHRYELNTGMQQLYMQNNSATSVPSRTQDKSANENNYDAQRQEIWQKYKAIASGTEQPSQPLPDTVAPSGAVTHTQNSGYGAGNILNSYQRAQEQRQKMQSLKFPAPNLEKMDE